MVTAGTEELCTCFSPATGEHTKQLRSTLPAAARHPQLFHPGAQAFVPSRAISVAITNRMCMRAQQFLFAASIRGSRNLFLPASVPVQAPFQCSLPHAHPNTHASHGLCPCRFSFRIVCTEIALPCKRKQLSCRVPRQELETARFGAIFGHLHPEQQQNTT